MNRYFWTIGLATISQIGYHIAQKSLPKLGPPFVVLAIAYAAACLMCLCLAFIPVIGRIPSIDELRASIAWPTWMVAFSIIGIEAGYLLAYRSGWSIGLAFAVASTVTIVALAAISAACFGSPLHLRRLAGIALACLSLWLLATGGGAP